MIVANELVRRGWKVGVVAFEIVKPDLLKLLDERLKYRNCPSCARMRNIRKWVISDERNWPRSWWTNGRFCACHHDAADSATWNEDNSVIIQRQIGTNGSWSQKALGECYAVAYKLNLKLVYWLCDASVVFESQCVFRDAAG